jgi:translation initiation factor IF-2
VYPVPEMKVKDVADELNTKSKKVIEKLDELKIIGKGPMSKLSEEEVQKFYEYIGFIRPKKEDEIDTVQPEQKKEPAIRPAAATEKPAPTQHKGQYIIRRTENVIDNKNKDSLQKKDPKKRYIVSSDDSGLLQGYTTKAKIKKPVEAPAEEKIAPVAEQPKEEPVKAVKIEAPAAEIKAAVPEPEKIVIEAKTTEAVPVVPQEIQKSEMPAPAAEVISPEPQKIEYIKQEPAKTEAPKTEYKRSETPKTEYKRPEAPRTEYKRSDAPRTEYKRSDAPRTEYKRPDAQRTEYKRPDAPRTEYRRPESPGTEHKRTEYKKPEYSSRPAYSKPEGDRAVTVRTEYKRPSADGRKDYGQRPSRPSTGVFGKDKDEDGAGAKGLRPVRKQIKPDGTSSLAPVIKTEKAQDKKPGKKIEQQKQAKKESATEGTKTKKVTRTSDDIVVVDLKTTARLFSEDQVAETGLADEKVLDYYSKSAPKFKQRLKRNKNKKMFQQELQKPAIPSVIKIDETISVKDFAEIIKKTAGAVILKLISLGVMVSANEMIDFDTATLVAEDFNIKTVLKENITEEDILFDDTKEDSKDLVTRPPIVVVMGHVDHGKTSLLDAIKNTNVIDTEAGGITQHIGAYMVNVHGRDITFLDTPGHEAFTSLRARGAQVTDIAILVVAADDGIMPQTVEAINHAKAAKVSIIVAINKIDKPNANIEKVKQGLTEYGLVPEEWGGDTVCVPISAKLNQNIGELLDMVILTADMLDLKANPDKQAKGTVIDASLDKNKGVITTVIVQRGTLKLGDSVVTGTTVGRIRAMYDYKGMPITKAGPSTPVELAGMPDVPEAGELFYAISDQKLARQLAEKRKVKIREEQIKKQNIVTLEDLFKRIKEGEIKDLNIILKADVQGSIEALKQSLIKLGNDEIAVKIIHDAVGTITETDVSLAQVSGATIIGFNVRPSASVAETAASVGVDIRLYDIIYEAIEDVEKAIKGMLAPKFKEEILGHAEIRETFKVSGIGTIAGCYVLDGKIVRNSKIRLVRNGAVVHMGELASLKRFKDDAREVAAGYECGISVDKYNDIKIGDVIEAYHIVEEVRS